jgi:hypothetical protein
VAESEITVEPDEILGMLAWYRARLGRMRPVMGVVGELLVNAVAEEWDTAGHGKWPPLARSTLQGRRVVGARGQKFGGRGRGRRQGGSVSVQILKNTGRAYASVRSFHGEDFAEAASDVDYLKYHVAEGPHTRIPLRNPFDIAPARLDEARDIVLRGILGEPL